MQKPEVLTPDEGLFRHTLDNMLEGMQIHDSNWRYLYVNDALLKYSHYPREELIGFTVMEKYPGIEHTELFAVMKRCMETRTSERFTTDFVYPNGDTGHFEVSIQPVPQGISILSIDVTERKKAEALLRQAEANYREIFDNATDAIFICDIEKGKLVEVNQKASELTGYTKEELLHSYFHDFATDYAGHNAQKIKSYLQKVATGDPQKFEWLSKKKDGFYTWLEVHLKKVTLAGEEKVLAFFSEINERKRDEEKIRKLNEKLEIKVKDRTSQLENHIQQLKESEERFQKVFQTSGAAIAITHMATGKYLDINNAFAELVGYSKEEVIGRSSVELGIIMDVSRREEMINYIKEFGSAKHLEITLFDKTGNKKEVLSSAETIVLKGEDYGIYILFDITERKEIEDRLKKSDALFSSLFEHNPACFAISRIRDRKVLNVNESFLRFFGFANKEEVVGHTAGELQMDNPKQREEIMKLLKENNKLVNVEGAVQTRQGESKWVATSLLSIELNDEPCLLTVLLDISKRKKAEELLEEVNRELEAFTYSVSHDLRAPLRAVNGYAQILMEDYGHSLDEEGKAVIGTIKKNASKMGRLIDDLLSFSRLGRKELQKSEIDANKLVASVKWEIDRYMDHKAKITIHPLTHVKADHGLLHQVMYNLICNGVKYSAQKADPQVDISSQEKEEEVVFCVKDNGAGFDMQYVDKLFGVFQRLHSQEEFAGTGVGLAIVQRIIAKHGGRVWAEGEKEKGASFYFSLPKSI